MAALYSTCINIILLTCKHQKQLIWSWFGVGWTRLRACPNTHTWSICELSSTYLCDVWSVIATVPKCLLWPQACGRLSKLTRTCLIKKDVYKHCIWLNWMFCWNKYVGSSIQSYSYNQQNIFLIHYNEKGKWKGYDISYLSWQYQYQQTVVIWVVHLALNLKRY